MRLHELNEGGWDNTVTQDTVITPDVVKSVMGVMKQFETDFNKFLAGQNIPPVKLGHPTGSSAYHEIASKEVPDKVYGDVDLQLIVPELPEFTGDDANKAPGFWSRKSKEFIDTSKPNYVHPDSAVGHPIVEFAPGKWVQVDLMPQEESLSHWGRFRVTPERGIKGMLTGNMFSVLGDLLDMSIQHRGAVYKFRDNARQPYSKTRHNKKQGRYQLVTVTTDIENFIQDIFNHEYEMIAGEKASQAVIDPALEKNPGINTEQVRIIDLVNGVKGLAASFEHNDMYGKGALSKYSSAQDFLDSFRSDYVRKAEKDINSDKRDKATTPAAKARADADRKKIQDGLRTVLHYFN